MIAGNAVHFRCQTPIHLARHLDFIGWLKDDKPLMVADLSQQEREERGALARPRWLVRQPKYLMLPGGELLIRNASKLDAGAYRCRARHRLSGATATSKIAGRLMVDESRERVELRPTSASLSAGRAQLVTKWARENSEILLCAWVQSFPAASFAWFKVTAQGERQPLANSSEYNQLDSCLLIRQVQRHHAGEYLCQASSGWGQPASGTLTSSIRLLVASQALSAQLQLVQPSTRPQLSPVGGGPALVPFASSVYLNCSITGFPYNTIAWFRDGRLLATARAPYATGSQSGWIQPMESNTSNWRLSAANSMSERVKIVQATVIQIDNFGLNERGVYQCQAYTTHLETLEQLNLSSDSLALAERDWSRSTSANIQLELALGRPLLVGKFQPTTLHQGATLALECAATALPTAKIFWFLDNYLIASDSHGETEDAVQQALDYTRDELALETIWRPEAEVELGVHQPWRRITDERFSVSSRLEQVGPNGQPTLVSQLNVSRLSGVEGGSYKCLALNPLGSAQHVGQVSVLAEVQLRAFQPSNLTLIAGRTEHLQCPIVGFPLGRVDWFHNGQRLPANHRQRIEPILAGSGGQLELSKVDESTDGGLYTCRATMLAKLPQQANGTSEISARQAAFEPESEQDREALDKSQLEGQVRAIVRVAPLIDVQSLPDVLQTSEGMRTKLVCSVVQGDHPVEVKWLRRVHDRRGRGRLLQQMQNAAGAEEGSWSVHNLEDSSLLTFKQIGQADSADYLCLASNQYGQALRWTRVIVNVAPSWSSEPSAELNLILGARMQLDCGAHGFPAPSIAWRRQSSSSVDGKQAPGDFSDLVSNYRVRGHANGSLIIEQIDLQDAGLYMCEVSNGIGGGLSKLVRVRVNVPPYFKQRSGTQLSQLNAKVELRCSAHGDQPMLIGWRKDNEIVDLLNDSRHRLVSERRLSTTTFESTLTVDNVTRLDSGQYACIASNEFGSDDLRIQLVVQEPPEAPSAPRLVRATARQVTIAFRPPYAGNSLIRKYSVSYRALQFSSEESPLNGTDFSSGWQQVSLEAPGQSSEQDDKSTSPNRAESDQLVSLNICCLQPFTRYVARVRALNDIGQSELSKPIQFETDEEAIGGPPLDVAVEPTGAHSLKVRWRAPVKGLQNGLVRGYYIGYRALSSGVHQAGAGFSADGAQSKPQSANGRPVEGADSEQYQYKNVQFDLNQLNLRQLTPSGPDVNSSGARGQLPAQILTSYLTNLRRKTAYSVIVQAYNKIGAGPRSDQVVVSTLDAAPPMSPILRVISSGFNSAQLSWSSRRFGSSLLKLNGSTGSRTSSTPPHPLLDLSEAGAELEPIDEDDDPQSHFTLYYRAESRGQAGGASSASNQDDDWQQRKIPKRQPLPYTLDNLRCGSHHSAFITATNSLGQSEPGETVKFATLGAAPLAPGSSRELLQVNLTQVTVRLGSWQNVGCTIGSFLLKYKQANQAKWTILEHQVYPTVQTVTIAGSPMFTAKSANPNEPNAEEPAQRLGLPGSSNQNIGDLVIRNLLAGSVYKLMVEANSEAGTTMAEYEFETANFTSSTISVLVSGISASDWPQLVARNRGLRQDSDPGELDFSYSGGQQAPGIFGGARHKLGIWSLTAVLVMASIVMALFTLIFGLRGLARPKRSARNPQESLISAMLCCSHSSGSSSTGADSSHSSSAGTCYQISEHPLDAYCSLPAPGGHGFRAEASELATPARVVSHQDRLASAEEAGLRHLTSSSSLSTIGGRFHTLSRHMNPVTGSPQSRSVKRQSPTLDDGQARIRPQYAATLGKQHLSSSFISGSQPIKFNLNSTTLAHNQELGSDQSYYPPSSTQTAFRQRAISSNGTTSGYETSSNSMKLSSLEAQPLVGCNGQPVYLQGVELYTDMYNTGSEMCDGNLLSQGNGRSFGQRNESEMGGAQGQCLYGLAGSEEQCKAMSFQQPLPNNNGVVNNQAEIQPAFNHADIYGMIFGAQQRQQQQQQIQLEPMTSLDGGFITTSQQNQFG